MMLMEKLHNVRMTPLYMGRHYKDDWEADKWEVTVEYQRRTMEIPYYMGTGNGGVEPSTVEVLNSLFLDSAVGDMTFEDFCSEFGYNSDSRKSLKIYEECNENTESLRKVLGDDFDEIARTVEEIENGVYESEF
jgi:hypothetical protein